VVLAGLPTRQIGTLAMTTETMSPEQSSEAPRSIGDLRPGKAATSVDNTISVRDFRRDGLMEQR